MKQCPACGSTFTDDSLRFCLQDGATLRRLSEPPTSADLSENPNDEAQSERDEPPPTEKFDFNAAPTVYSKQAAQTVPPRSRPNTRESSRDDAATKRPHPFMVAGITALVVLALAAVGLGIVYLLRDKSSNSVNTTPAGNNAQPANVASPNANSSPARANVNASQTNAEARTDTSVRITATASSTRPDLRDISYAPSNVLDGSILTAWIEGATGPGVGEWLRCDFDREVKLKRIYLTPGYFKSTELWEENNRLAAATFTFSDGTSRRFTFPDRMQEQRLDVGGVKTRWVRMEINDTYPGTVDPEDTPVSQMTFEFDK